MTETAASDNRRRLSLVTTELSVGGAEQCLVNIALRIDRSRFAPVVYSLFPPPAPPRDGLVRRLNDAGIETCFLGLRRKTQLLSAVRDLAQHFRDQRTEVVQSFLFHANIVAAWAARRAGVRRVVTGWRVADRRRWRPKIEAWMTRGADRVACVSQLVADQALAAGVPRDKVVVIPNGVDCSRFKNVIPQENEQLGSAPHRKLLVAIGRLDYQKGFDWLLEFADQILSRLPEHDLVIVGEGRQRPELQALVVREKLEGRVFLPGWNPDLPGVLAAASVIVIPSRWEGMPNVLLEAMASRRPVVATRVEGVAEVLGPLAEPQSVEWGDAAGFVAKVATIALDSQLAESLGKANVDRVDRQFTLDAMVQTYESLYAGDA